VKYSQIQRTYFTASEQETNPSCFVQPSTTEEVSLVVKILTSTNNKNNAGCKFAVKSGGYVAIGLIGIHVLIFMYSHATWAGAANIDKGVTIDLVNLNVVEVSSDNKLTKIGPGNRWEQVYAKIGDQGLAVAGGRWGNVGVGGLLTGGGISFFPGVRGLACDAIRNHEVQPFELH
jgi:FAD/FMN-containing dehydrogenase